MPFFSVLITAYTRRPRGSGRNRRLGDSSDVSDERLDSDDSEANIDDHVDDSLDVQSTSDSEDDPRGEPTTRTRRTDTREGYPHVLIVTAHANYQARRK
jgi:hypothetical protein